MKWRGGLAILLIFVACTNNTKIPSDIIGKEKMEKILWDMVQADRFVQTFIMVKKDSSEDKKKEAAIFYERVFQMTGISRDEFIKSYKYYLSRPDITKTLFDSISARADRRRAEVHSGRRNPFLEKRDSLKRLDSIRQADSLLRMDSINSVDTGSTSEMSDSALRELLFK